MAEPVPPGDAGLERQTDEHDLWPEAEANVGLAAATREIARLREQVAELESAHSATVKLRGLFESHMDMARGQLRCVAEIDRLQAQLVAQQAVVDAARQAVRGRMGGYVALREALRALDQAQAAQPEGERLSQ